MSKLFYDHLIPIEKVLVVLDEYEVSPDERTEILSIIDETVHHHVLDVIFTHLPNEHHEEFLELLASSPQHERLFQYIHEKSYTDVENHVSHVVSGLLADLIQEIHNTYHEENQ